MGQDIPILIAIADDHPAIRAGLKSMIEQLDFGGNVFIEASDGHELLDKIAASTLQPDICLIDISMEGMNGYDTMRNIRELYPMVRGIAISLHDDEFHILNMMQNGAQGYLSKKINSDSLKKAILAVYKGGRYFSEDILSKYPALARMKLHELADKLPNEREQRFLALCSYNKSYKAIAEVLKISTRTAEHIGERLGWKLKLHSRAQLGMYAEQAGLTTDSDKNT